MIYCIEGLLETISIIPVKSPLSKPFNILSMRKERQKSIEWFFQNPD